MYDEIKPWNGEAAGTERFVWLHCYGMPLNVWNVPTFEVIGNKWEKFLEVDGKTLRQEAYDKAKFLIVTEDEKKREDQIQQKVEEKMYKDQGRGVGNV